MRERLRTAALTVGPPVAVGAVLGLIGPFGTFQALALPVRLGYWISVVAVNWLLCDLAIRRLDILLPDRLPGRHFVVPITGGLIVSAPATAVVHLAGVMAGLGAGNLIVLFWQVLLLCVVLSIVFYLNAPEQGAGNGVLPGAVPPREPGPAPEPSSTLAVPSTPSISEPVHETVPGPAPVAMALTARETNSRPLATGGADVQDSPSRDADLFFRRLEEPLVGELLCLEMQDHYMAVHSAGGRQLVLCRMADATAELATLGRRVHRSWWVADTAIEAIERNNGRLNVRLTNGWRVPVGRSYRAALQPLMNARQAEKRT